jgi:hypothetical protein
MVAMRVYNILVYVMIDQLLINISDASLQVRMFMNN